jgi:uncharacterized protein YbaP (TraB family)
VKTLFVIGPALVVALLLTGCAAMQSNSNVYPPLWKIASPNGQSNVWLFGTVHTMPPGKSYRMQAVQRVLSGVSPRLLRPEWVSNQLYNALVSSNKLIIELDINRQLRNDNDAMLQFLKSDLQRLELHDPEVAQLPALHDYHLEQDLLLSLQAEAAARNINLGDLQQLPLPSLLLAFSIRPSNNIEALSLPGAEDWLVALMRLRDRDIAGLEQIDSRQEALTRVFLQVPVSEHVEIMRHYLQTSITSSDSIADDLELIYARWLGGDSPERERSRAMFALRYPAIYKAFISHRNELWLEPIIEQIHSGDRVFIAVGEAHLNGPNNLREMLARKGYQLQRIQ